MGNGKIALAIVLAIVVIGYYTISLDYLDYLQIDATITTKIDSLFEQKWPLVGIVVGEEGMESISAFSNKTIEIIENRTGLTLDISQKEDKIEQEIHRLVNDHRQTIGLASLKYDKKLAVVGKLHSIDMAKRKFFSHENPDGQTPSDRGAELEYYCVKINGIYITSGIAENIFMSTSSGTTFWYSADQIAQKAVKGWMESLGHRKNVLNEKYKAEGIGVVISDNAIHVTQNFC